jgi:hypothetical protein
MLIPHYLLMDIYEHMRYVSSAQVSYSMPVDGISLQSECPFSNVYSWISMIGHKTS